ncbi:MAG: sigma-54 dependent transcriptional regulator [Desulfuromonadales bacterium]
MKKRIYICDDEEGMVRYLGKTVINWGFEPLPFTSPAALLAALARDGSEGGMLLLDVRMPEMDGLVVLQRALALRPEMAVVMMTGYGTIDSAVEAIRLGAFDYLTKPFPEERLGTAILNGLKTPRAENLALPEEPQAREGAGTIVLHSDAFREVFHLAQRVGESEVNILLLGESGTGKELVAEAIHAASSRAGKRMLAINCGALAETLLESQLFGHLRGAFTGAAQTQKGILEAADGGTLFLDEVGDLSPALQVKLLRVLQEGEFLPVGATLPRRVKVRFIAATNKDLEAEVAAGNFRQDLYYRLNVFSLQLPPLRERPEDIQPLASHFLALAAKRSGKPLRGIAPAALAALRDYPWPGNVRELQNIIERGAILAGGEMLEVEDLPRKLIQPAPIPEKAGEAVTLRDAERLQVLRMLRRTGWNKSRAARLLDIARPTLDRKIVEYGLTPE